MMSIKTLFVSSVLLSLTVQSLVAQAPGTPNAAKKPDKAGAYYHYSLGHLYGELASTYGNKGDYLNKAIDNLRLALKADPEAGFIAEELSDLYIQSGRLKEAVTDAEEAIRQNPNDVNARRILGRIYTRMIGDPQAQRIDEKMLKNAIDQYQAVVERAPRDTDSWLMLARLQKIAQNSPESEKAYKKVLEVEPDNDDAMMGLAMVYSDLGDTKSATELLRKLAEKQPSLRALTSLAQAYEQAREYALAAETLRRTLELAPSNVEVKRALAQNLLFSEQFDDALKHYNEIVAQDARDVQSFLRISQIYRQQRKLKEARQAADKARALEPNNLEIRYNDVNLLEAEGKSAEAITALRDIVTSTAKKSYTPAEKSNRALLLERLGLMLRASEQYPKAIEVFRQVLELDTDLGARVAAHVVDTLRAGREFAKAQQEAEAALAKYPNDRYLRMTNATLLAETGRADEAVAILEKLLDGKNDREIQLALAQIYEKAKNYAAMGKTIDAAEKLSESNDDKETVYFLRGAMYEKQKKFDEAEAEFRKVIEINPTSASALNYLGYMLADRNVRLSEAHQLINKAIELEPHNGAYLDSLGWVLYRLGRFSEAEQQLLRSLDRVSRDPTVHDHLGDVYFQQGKLREAIQQWQASLKEWEATAKSEFDPVEVAKINKKLEGARVRLAKEGTPAAPKP